VAADNINTSSQELVCPPIIVRNNSPSLPSVAGASNYCPRRAPFFRYHTKLNSKGNSDPGHAFSSSAFRYRQTAGFVESEGRWQALPIDLATALGDSLVLHE
jgi:hypothetical protein